MDYLLSNRRFTQREIAIVRLLSKGRTNVEIAAELGISVRTLGNTLATIYDKLNARDRAHAVYRAVEEGLLKVA